MSAARDEVADPVMLRLSTLELQHQAIQRQHERMLRFLDQTCASVDRGGLLAAWNQYRAAVAELCRVTGEMESLRLSIG